MATQFEYELVELAGECRSVSLALDALERDRQLAELR
jgi:hypothetical protein